MSAASVQNTRAVQGSQQQQGPTETGRCTAWGHGEFAFNVRLSSFIASLYRQFVILLMQIYMQYPFERTVESVVKKSVFEGRGFGAKMTVEQLIAKQTRIERY